MFIERSELFCLHNFIECPADYNEVSEQKASSNWAIQTPGLEEGGDCDFYSADFEVGLVETTVDAKWPSSS